MKKLIKRVVPAKTFKKAEPYGHLAESLVYQTKAGFPARAIKVIGVTGTDGKTTTCTLITQMLRHSGKKVAMMTTISVDYGDGNGPQDNPSRLTTFGAKRLAKTITRMKNEGIEWLVLEVTSHALSQYRTWGVPIHLAVFTNLGHEHLDYHGTFENYRDAKRRLFKLANKNKHGLQIGIVNADDGVADYFAQDIAHPLRYGIKSGDIRAVNIALTPSGSTYRAAIISPELQAITKDLDISCQLPGSFNIYNSLATIGVGLAIGLSKPEIEQGIASLKNVEGRMTRVDEGQNFAVIVDYAHTPESFEKIFAEVRPLAKKRLICVFGSAGRRDEAKRAKQGEIAGEWCDIVFVTEEDDRDIDGHMILEQIAGGAEQNGKTKDKDLFLIHDREKAVEAAIGMAQKDDLVILLGKGHEKSILYNGPQAATLRHLPQDDGDPRRVLKRPYDEVTVARQALQQRRKRQD